MLTANALASYRTQKTTMARSGDCAGNSPDTSAQAQTGSTARNPSPLSLSLASARDTLASANDTFDSVAPEAALNASLTESQLAEVIARNALPTELSAGAKLQFLAAARPGVSLLVARRDAAAAQADIVPDQALQKVTSQFQQRFATRAGDKARFHALMKNSFGRQYDVASAETLRQQTLKGDFSWMPQVKLVDSASLQDTSGTQGEGSALGAYSKENNTVYLSRELLHSDPVRAEKILSEEIGHSIDTMINKSDAAGDEGAIFARLSHGEKISASELAALRSENDGGTIEIDGKSVEVEYGFFKKLKKAVSRPFKKVRKAVRKIGSKVKKAFSKVGSTIKKIGKKIKKGLSKAWKKVKSVVKKVLSSKIVGYVLAVARFIPIPVVQGVAMVLNAARAAYSVYQGLKHKGLGAVLGGVASIAGGVASYGGSLGLSANALKTAGNIANYAGTASKAYRAVARKDFASAAALASNYFGASSAVGKALDTAVKADKVYQAARSDNPFAAISAGADLVQDFTGPAGDRTLQSIASNARAFGQVRQALREGDYTGALNAASTAFADQSGLATSAQRSVRQFTATVSAIQSAVKLAESGDYRQAGQTLLQQGRAVGGAAAQKLEAVGQVLLKVDAAATAIGQQRYATAATLAADALGVPLDNRTKEVLTQIQAHAEQGIALKRAVAVRDVRTAAQIIDRLTQGKIPGLVDHLDSIAGFTASAAQLRQSVDSKDFSRAAAIASEMATALAANGKELAGTLKTLSAILAGKVQIPLGDIFSSDGRTPGINPAAAA